jgi:hypothetical protein
LVIPAGTEIHGTAQTDHQRERIASGNSWTLIWQNGMEMQIKAIALDREFDDETNQSGWAITDGSAGLRGEVIKSDNLADIKLFAATFLSGAAGALTEKQQTVFGPVNSPTLNNAPFAGAQAVLQTYAHKSSIQFKRTGSTSACRAENNFISTSCKPLTPPTPHSAAPPFPSPRKMTNKPQPNQDHENVLSHSTVASLRVFHRTEVDTAPTAMNAIAIRT